MDAGRLGNRRVRNSGTERTGAEDDRPRDSGADVNPISSGSIDLTERTLYATLLIQARPVEDPTNDAEKGRAHLKSRSSTPDHGDKKRRRKKYATSRDGNVAEHGIVATAWQPRCLSCVEKRK